MNKQNIKNIKILTPEGFKSFWGIQKLHKECLELKFEDISLTCAVLHRICIDKEKKIFKKANELKIGDLIETKHGYKKLIDIKNVGIKEVYDPLNVEGNIYYTNGILSHNCEFDQVGEAAIDTDLFESMKKYTFEPLYVYEDGKYLLWEQPNEERIYAAGVDISEGIGKNASVIQILDITEPRNIKQVAVYHNNKISPSEFTPKLREILQHWGDPYALIERNNCGGQVVDNLKREYNYDNLVNWGITKASGRLTNQYGMLAHTNTKLAAVLNQRYWVSIAKTVHINDIHTVLELKDFVRSKNNSWGAKHGSNDDRVMALVWALMILHEDIAPIYFDIIDKDENNKPSIIKSIDYGIRNYINLNSIYTNEKNGLGGDAMPIIMGSNKHSDQPDLDDLYTQGWKPYLG